MCAGILDKIQKEFNANDAMMGLLQTAFIISYMFFAPLFGYLGMWRDQCHYEEDFKSRLCCYSWEGSFQVEKGNLHRWARTLKIISAISNIRHWAFPPDIGKNFVGLKVPIWV